MQDNRRSINLAQQSRFDVPSSSRMGGGRQPGLAPDRVGHDRLDTAKTMMIMDGIGPIVGAFSTAISALALIGIVIALRLQLRQARISQLQASNTLLLELMRLHMENPGYRQVWGEVTAPLDSDLWSRNTYRNLVFMYYQMLLSLDVLSEAGVRGQIRSLLGTEEARQWWVKARPAYQREAKNRTQNRFIAIMEEEWATLGGEAESIKKKP